MEFKVRKESQTLMEKTFNKFARRGSVRADQVPEMMKQMQVECNLDDVRNAVDSIAGGNGSIDLDAFNKIALHFLIKQAKHDHDQFIHKHEIGSQDFPNDAPLL